MLLQIGEPVCGITSVAFSVSGRLLFAGYDDFECKVRPLVPISTDCMEQLLITTGVGMGRPPRRASGHSRGPRQPRELSGREQRCHLPLHGLLGFDGEFVPQNLAD